MSFQSVTSHPVVAIAGATGHLGQYIAAAFLSQEFRPKFSKIILLSRQAPGASSPLAGWEKNNGAIISIYDENDLSSSLKDVDIFVNAIGSSGHDFKEKLLRSLPNTKVSLYFPSEFGVDHTIHDFSHAEWGQKKRHFELAGQVVPKIQVCRVFCGLFLEDGIGPWFGFNTAGGKYESIGSSNARTTYTSLVDVGKTVASATLLPRDKIPTEMHISGDAASMSEVANKMEKAGAGKITITEADLPCYRETTIAGQTATPTKYLRFLMGEGLIDQSPQGLGNQNELVNPREELWRWRTIDDLAHETGGKPWADNK